MLLKLHISVKITSKIWNFVSQDINDNAPIFDRANYDVPVAQVNYFARWHHLFLHHNYQPPSILMAIDKVILSTWWEKESCKTWPICWLTVLRQCFVGESRLFKCCRKTNLLHRLALSISTFFLGILFPNFLKNTWRKILGFYSSASKQVTFSYKGLTFLKSLWWCTYSL